MAKFKVGLTYDGMLTVEASEEDLKEFFRPPVYSWADLFTGKALGDLFYGRVTPRDWFSRLFSREPKSKIGDSQIRFNSSGTVATVQLSTVKDFEEFNEIVAARERSEFPDPDSEESKDGMYYGSLQDKAFSALGRAQECRFTNGDVSFDGGVLTVKGEERIAKLEEAGLRPVRSVGSSSASVKLTSLKDVDNACDCIENLAAVGVAIGGVQTYQERVRKWGTNNLTYIKFDKEAGVFTLSENLSQKSELQYKPALMEAFSKSNGECKFEITNTAQAEEFQAFLDNYGRQYVLPTEYSPMQENFNAWKKKLGQNEAADRNVTDKVPPLEIKNGYLYVRESNGVQTPEELLKMYFGNDAKIEADESQAGLVATATAYAAYYFGSWLPLTVTTPSKKIKLDSTNIQFATTLVQEERNKYSLEDGQITKLVSDINKLNPAQKEPSVNVNQQPAVNNSTGNSTKGFERVLMEENEDGVLIETGKRIKFENGVLTVTGGTLIRSLVEFELDAQDQKHGGWLWGEPSATVEVTSANLANVTKFLGEFKSSLYPNTTDSTKFDEDKKIIAGSVTATAGSSSSSTILHGYERNTNNNNNNNNNEVPSNKNEVPSNKFPSVR